SSCPTLLPELGMMSQPPGVLDTPGGTATGAESSTRALSSNAQGGKNMRKGFAAVLSVVASSVLLSGLTEAHVTSVQAPRMKAVQAPRMQEVQAPQMQEVQPPAGAVGRAPGTE